MRFCRGYRPSSARSDETILASIKDYWCGNHYQRYALLNIRDALVAENKAFSAFGGVGFEVRVDDLAFNIEAERFLVWSRCSESAMKSPLACGQSLRAD